MEDLIYELYQRLGDFFTGRDKRRLFYLFSALFGSCLLRLLIYADYGFDSDTLFWTFSTTVQSLMALVALMGVMVVFKFQNMSTQEDRLITELNKDKSSLGHLGGKLDAVSLTELIENINRCIGSQEPVGGGHAGRLWEYKEILIHNLMTRRFFHYYTTRFAVYTLAVVMVNLIFLVATPILATSIISSSVSIFVSLFMTSYALFLTIKGVAEVIAGELN